MSDDTSLGDPARRRLEDAFESIGADDEREARRIDWRRQGGPATRLASGHAST